MFLPYLSSLLAGTDFFPGRRQGQLSSGLNTGQLACCPFFRQPAWLQGPSECFLPKTHHSVLATFVHARAEAAGQEKEPVKAKVTPHTSESQDASVHQTTLAWFLLFQKKELGPHTRCQRACLKSHGDLVAPWLLLG